MYSQLRLASSIGSPSNAGYLLRAWNDLKNKSPKKRRSSTAGIDGVTIDDFEKDLVGNLRRISRLMRSNKYRFTPLKTVLIKKSNGKDRLICIPTVADRLVQKSIQMLLCDDYKFKFGQFNGVNYGFVRNKSTVKAINKAVELRSKHPYVYKTDITNFFDTIPRDELKEMIRNNVRKSSLHPILFKAIDCDIEEVYGTKKKKIKNLLPDRCQGVRQGMPLSPLFANLVLFNFDAEIQAYQFHALRYADDLIFFADSIKACRKIHDFCKTELNKIRLSIPEIGDQSQKTVIQRPQETTDFLGLGIERTQGGQYIAIVTRTQIDTIRENILHYSDMDYLLANKISIRTYAITIRSVISGYESVYCECSNFDTLKNQMKQWGQKASNRLLKSNFGIDIERLSSKQKAFLNILD